MMMMKIEKNKLNQFTYVVRESRRLRHQPDQKNGNRLDAGEDMAKDRESWL